MGADPTELGHSAPTASSGDDGGMQTIPAAKFKPSDKYLHPHTWCGDPVPDGHIGPWGLMQTCWYVLLRFEDGGYKGFAAETAERATEAARAWAEEHPDRRWLTDD